MYEDLYTLHYAGNGIDIPVFPLPVFEVTDFLIIEPLAALFAVSLGFILGCEGMKSLRVFRGPLAFLLSSEASPESVAHSGTWDLEIMSVLIHIVGHSKDH